MMKIIFGKLVFQVMDRALVNTDSSYERDIQWIS